MTHEELQAALDPAELRCGLQPILPKPSSAGRNCLRAGCSHSVA